MERILTSESAPWSTPGQTKVTNSWHLLCTTKLHTERQNRKREKLFVANYFPILCPDTMGPVLTIGNKQPFWSRICDFFLSAKIFTKLFSRDRFLKKISWKCWWTIIWMRLHIDFNPIVFRYMSNIAQPSWIGGSLRLYRKILLPVPVSSVDLVRTKQSQWKNSFYLNSEKIT